MARQNRTVTMSHIDGKPGQVWYPLQLQKLDFPKVGPGEVLVHPTHISLNHRDLFLRQRLYPSPSFQTSMFSDAVAQEIDPQSFKSRSRRIILIPGIGWDKDRIGPERPYSILGGTSSNSLGVAQDLLVVKQNLVVDCPPHLSDEEAAALPLVGLTAWRALVEKSGAAQEGKNILITGIGGGVAVAALLFAVKMGVRVWVTSGSQAKLAKAKMLGAQSGVLYTDKSWDKQLKSYLPESRPYFDAIIDGAGGDIGDKAAKLLKHGGVLVSYGMTLGPKISIPMSAVLKNIDLRCSTMGSALEFREMVAFVDKHKIRPVVSRVVEGDLCDIAKWDDLYEDMRDSKQFGKLVFAIRSALFKDPAGQARL